MKQFQNSALLSLISTHSFTAVLWLALTITQQLVPPASSGPSSSSSVSGHGVLTFLHSFYLSACWLTVVLVVTSFFTILIRRVFARNPRRRVGWPNSYPINSMPSGGRPFRAPPMPFAHPPARPGPVQFPSPSIPLNESTPYHIHPRQSHPFSAETRPPVFPAAQYLSPSIVPSSATPNLSRGPSVASSSLYTAPPQTAVPTRSIFPSPILTSEADEVVEVEPSHVPVTEQAPSSSMPPLRDAMASHQKQLIAEEMRRNAMPTPADPPPRYSE